MFLLLSVLGLVFIDVVLLLDTDGRCVDEKPCILSGDDDTRVMMTIAAHDDVDVILCFLDVFMMLYYA